MVFIIFKFLKRGQTIDSDVYVNFLKAMFIFFANQHQLLLKENIRLIHDNARPHLSQNIIISNGTYVFNINVFFYFST